MKNFPQLENKDYLIRISVIALAAIAPFICIFSQGIQISISTYWKTDLQPLFIVANALTSYYLYSVKNWKLSAVMLLLLTAFSVDLYGALHDTLAITFFLVNLYPLFVSHHYRWIIIPYLTSLPVLIFFGMLWAEIVAIWSLCLYHGIALTKFYQFTYRNKPIEDGE